MQKAHLEQSVNFDDSSQYYTANMMNLKSVESIKKMELKALIDKTVE